MKQPTKLGLIILIMLMLSTAFSQKSIASTTSDFQNILIEGNKSNMEKAEGEIDSSKIEQYLKTSLEKPTISADSQKNKQKSTSGGKDFSTLGVSGELLFNNDFESGHSNWSEWTSVNGAPIFQNTSIITNNSALSASGSWYAFLLSSNTYKDVLFGNEFILPINSTELTLDYNGVFVRSGTCTLGSNTFFVGFYDVTTSETIDTITLNDANLEVSDEDYYNYIFDTKANLIGRGGHTIRMLFSSIKSDSNCGMGLYLDDVNLTAMIDTPMYRLYNTSNGAYLYTRGAADRDHVLNTWPEFEFTDGIPAFFAPMNYSAGLTPMYRLYNTLNGAYLYARGEADKNHVMTTWPEFEFTDGVPAFYASLSQDQDGTLTPIYRLYNTLNGMYLYTRGEADRNHVTSTWPEFEFTDGIPAFYAEIN